MSYFYRIFIKYESESLSSCIRIPTVQMKQLTYATFENVYKIMQNTCSLFRKTLKIIIMYIIKTKNVEYCFNTYFIKVKELLL